MLEVVVVKLSDLVFEAVTAEVEVCRADDGGDGAGGGGGGGGGGGQPVTVRVRALTHAEKVAVRSVFVPPEPPLMPDPNKGSLAPKIPNVDDPEYIYQSERWQGRFERACVAIATGYEVDGVAFPGADAASNVLKDWVHAAEKTIGQNVPAAVMLLLVNALSRLSAPGAVRGQIRKN